MITDTLIITAPKWKQPKYLTKEWINKLWYIHPSKQWQKKKKELTTDLQNYMDESQNNYAERSQRTNIYCITPLI